MKNLSEKIETLQIILIARATGGAVTDEMEQQYKTFRSDVINHPALKDIVPEFLKSCRKTDEFWPIAKEESGSYAGRRQFVWDGFRPLLDKIESSVLSPADINVSAALEKFDSESVHQVWLKALERRETQPEGAITLARTLLETVCKHILDEHGQIYKADSDLPGLYKMTAKTLNIAPSQHSESIFQQILGGCTSVVEGLGAMRNRLKPHLTSFNLTILLSMPTLLPIQLSKLERKALTSLGLACLGGSGMINAVGSAFLPDHRSQSHPQSSSVSPKSSRQPSLAIRNQEEPP